MIYLLTRSVHWRGSESKESTLTLFLRNPPSIPLPYSTYEGSGVLPQSCNVSSGLRAVYQEEKRRNKQKYVQHRGPCFIHEFLYKHLHLSFLRGTGTKYACSTSPWERFSRDLLVFFKTSYSFDEYQCQKSYSVCLFLLRFLLLS